MHPDHAKTILRGLYLEARDKGHALDCALEAFTRGQYVASREVGFSGSQIQSVATNGTTIQFSIPAGVSSTAASELASQLYSLFFEVKAAFVSASVSSPTDAQIFAEMDRRLAPVYSFTNDFSNALRDWREVVL